MFEKDLQAACKLAKRQRGDYCFGLWRIAAPRLQARSTGNKNNFVLLFMNEFTSPFVDEVGLLGALFF